MFDPTRSGHALFRAMSPAGTTVGSGSLSGLTLGLVDGARGRAEQAIDDLLALGAFGLDPSGPGDPLTALRNGRCDVVVGSDPEGMLRRAAGRFGLFGIRVGRASPRDGRPGDLAGWGWIARDPSGFARVAEALLPETASRLTDLPRCVIAADTFACLDEDVRGALATAIEGIEDLLGRAAMVELAPAGFAPLVAAYRQLAADEAASAFHGPDPGVTAFGPDVRDDDDRDDAEATRTAFATRLDRLLAGTGILLLPTLPDGGESAAQGGGPDDDPAAGHLCPAALAGVPQVSLPLGRLGEAAFGVSLLGPVGSDLSLCRLATRIARDLRLAA